MYMLKGLFIVRKIDKKYLEEFQAKLKERKITDKFIKKITTQETKGYGVLTRNFAKILAPLFYPKEVYTVTSENGRDCRYWGLKDKGGNSINVPLRGVVAEDSFHIHWGMGLIVACGGGPTRDITFDPYFAVGSGVTSPTPDDHDLVTTVQNIPISECRIIELSDRTELYVTGSGTASNDFTCSEVGVFTRLYHNGRVNDVPSSAYYMLDRAVLDSPISFVSGDPITVQYKLTLA